MHIAIKQFGENHFTIVEIVLCNSNNFIKKDIKRVDRELAVVAPIINDLEKYILNLEKYI